MCVRLRLKGPLIYVVLYWQVTVITLPVPSFFLSDRRVLLLLYDLVNLNHIPIWVIEEDLVPALYSVTAPV